MSNFEFLLSYGIFFAGLGAVAWWVATLDRPKKPHHPAAGE